MPHDFPIRLRVLKALTAVFESITPENGYNHDLSSASFRGRLYFGENDPLPMVSVLEPPLPPDPVYSATKNTAQICQWDLLVQGFVDDDIANPTDPAHMLLTDVRRALVIAKNLDQYNLLGVGPALSKMDLGNPVVRPSDDISAKAYFYLPIFFTIAEELADPFK